MTRELFVQTVGPRVTVQDMGRRGHLVHGLSRGGAADRQALFEGAALLNQPPGSAALELAGLGGTFEGSDDMRIALTGASMAASVDGTRLAWNASHLLPKGARLVIGAVEAGSYGYLHVGGGFDTPVTLGARSAHLTAGLGAPLSDGARLPIGADTDDRSGQRLDCDDRFSGGLIRLLPSAQTDLFPAEELARFEGTTYRRDTRGNRMGVPLVSDEPGFQIDTGLKILSETVVPGDVQITGDGTPYVLLCECQSMGGYPRLGTVLPADIPRVAQAPAGADLRFRFVSYAEGLAAERRAQAERAALRSRISPLIRDPHTMQDLLSYQLISGVTAGADP